MSEVNRMTLEEFRALPLLERPPLENIDALVILPMGAEQHELHYTGYRGMDYIACSKGKAIGRLSGFSDVLHIDGIGGFGKDWLEIYGTCPTMVPPTGWSVGCLAVSGLVRLYPSRDMCDGITLDDLSVSSFCIYGHLRADRDPRPRKVS